MSFSPRISRNSFRRPRNLLITRFREQISAVLPQEWIELILAMRLAVIRGSHVKRGIQPVPQVFRIGVINGYFEWDRLQSGLRLVRSCRFCGPIREGSAREKG